MGDPAPPNKKWPPLRWPFFIWRRRGGLRTASFAEATRSTAKAGTPKRTAKLASRVSARCGPLRPAHCEGMDAESGQRSWPRTQVRGADQEGLHNPAAQIRYPRSGFVAFLLYYSLTPLQGCDGRCSGVSPNQRTICRRLPNLSAASFRRVLSEKVWLALDTFS